MIPRNEYPRPHLVRENWINLNGQWDFEGIKQNDEVLRTVYRVTKEIDRTRPVIDTSGSFHVETDIFDVHDYEQNPKSFFENYVNLTDGNINDGVNQNAVIRHRQKYDGKAPIFVSEYGGIRWSDGDGWGYGEGPKTEEEFIERYKGLTEVLLNNEYMLGFCYTQLYDVEQEQNGLMTYHREFKFDPKIINKINSQAAVIEKEQ